MTFEDWMNSTGLSKSSIDKYVGAIDGPISIWAISHKLIDQPLRNILDPEVFAVLAAKIQTTPEYELRNTKGHGMYGAALRQYGKYLSSVADTVQVDGKLQGPHNAAIKVLEIAEDLQRMLRKARKTHDRKYCARLCVEEGSRNFAPSCSKRTKRSARSRDVAYRRSLKRHISPRILGLKLTR